MIPVKRSVDLTNFFSTFLSIQNIIYVCYVIYIMSKNHEILAISKATHLILKNMAWEGKVSMKGLVELAVVNLAMKGTLFGLGDRVAKAYYNTLAVFSNPSLDKSMFSEKEVKSRKDEYFLDELRKEIALWRTDFFSKK